MAHFLKLDPVDWALARVRQDDARTTNRELAAAVHVSPSTSTERVRALRADGVIERVEETPARDLYGNGHRPGHRVRYPRRSHIAHGRDTAVHDRQVAAVPGNHGPTFSHA
jgi:Winged helix-turn-helix DNA-binding